MTLISRLTLALAVALSFVLLPNPRQGPLVHDQLRLRAPEGTPGPTS